MTSLIKNSQAVLSRLFFVVILKLTGLLVLAQEKGLDVDINVKKESDWYQQPWVWVVGAAIFVLLLVALLRSGARDKGA